MSETIVLNLPEPPSVNAAYRNTAKGRAKTRSYRNWESECLWMIKGAKPGIVAGPFTVVLFLSEKTRKDVDNCLKPVLDLLGKVGVTEDDSRCYTVASTMSPDVTVGRCRIAIRPKTDDFFPFICIAERAGKAFDERETL